MQKHDYDKNKINYFKSAIALPLSSLPSLGYNGRVAIIPGMCSSVEICHKADDRVQIKLTYFELKTKEARGIGGINI